MRARSQRAATTSVHGIGMAKNVRQYATGRVLVGSCLERLPELADGSVDSIVTDPPYELGFMGKAWDASGIAYNVEMWRECLRVLKPGGHLLAFGGTRTYHRMTVAIEDAGFEIRDSIHWLYGSGFPKSHDVSKAIDKAAGVEREVVGTRRDVATRIYDGGEGQRLPSEIPITAPATDAAKQWSGWGTALKPAHEPIVLARKPLDGTVAANVLEHGTGALNIDGCRVGSETLPAQARGVARPEWRTAVAGAITPERTGRWPANVVLTHSDECDDTCVSGCPVAELDQQSGVSKSRVGKPRGTKKKGLFANSEFNKVGTEHDDEGGASRFFYVSKPGKKERNAGLKGLPEGEGVVYDRRPNGGMNARLHGADSKPQQNTHPTVKPVALMRYLVRLITPPNGVVLDPFLGSGTTAVAAILEGFEWVGCEMTTDYLPIIKGRVQHAQRQQQALF